MAKYQLKLPVDIPQRDLVRVAAYALDRFWPTDVTDGKQWWEFIVTSSLKMGSGCHCVLGQLGWSLAGYVPEEIRVRPGPKDERLIEFAYDADPPDEFEDEVPGYELIVNRSTAKDPDGDAAFSRWLWDVLRLELWFDQEVAEAFMSATPATHWKEEVRARRARAAAA